MKPIWIYGTHSVFEALANEDRVVYEARCTSASLKEKIISARPELKSVQIVDERSLLRLTGGVHQGVAICCEAKKISRKLVAEDFEDVDKILILDHLQDVNNIGSIIRSMAANEFSVIITSNNGMPNIEEAAIKSSCGGLEHVNLYQVSNIGDAVMKLKELGFYTLGLDHNASEYGDLRLDEKSDKIALVIGSEGQGIQKRVKNECDALFRLNTAVYFPILNAAVAAAIGMYLVNNF